VEAEHHRGDQCEGEKRERERPRLPPPGLPGGTAPCAFAREVRDEPVELGVGLRRETPPEPVLELLRVETPFRPSR
jgi:hypothetical protein